MYVMILHVYLIFNKFFTKCYYIVLNHIIIITYFLV